MSFVSILALAFVVFVTFVIGQGTNELALISAIIFVPSAIALYFAPMFVAMYHKHQQQVPIAVLNALAGWTMIGWVGALVWAYAKPAVQSGPASERQAVSASMRTCPYCAEEVRVEAIKCRHCQSDLTAHPIASPI